MNRNFKKNENSVKGQTNSLNVHFLSDVEKNCIDIFSQYPKKYCYLQFKSSKNLMEEIKIVWEKDQYPTTTNFSVWVVIPLEPVIKYNPLLDGILFPGRIKELEAS